MKKTLKVALYILLALVLIVLAYVIYVFAAYYRVEDWQTLSVVHCDAASAAPMADAPQTGVTYRVSSANVGFGAYSDDYSFFMDGGKESRARSRQAVDENMRGEVSLVKDLSPDFALFQEVDIDGTRSWHIAEDAYLSDVMENSEFNEVFAQNYDSPYLFYPLINPHGANQSGIVTLSRHPISSAVRRSLPIETGIMKLVDLDRCYSVSRIPMENGRELVLYNLHLSAYTSDGTIATEQLQMLCADMLAEYENGNSAILPRSSVSRAARTTPGRSPSPRGRSPTGSPLSCRLTPNTPSPPAARPTSPTTRRRPSASRSTASSCPIMSRSSPPMSSTQATATPTTIPSIWTSFWRRNKASKVKEASQKLASFLFSFT